VLPFPRSCIAPLLNSYFSATHHWQKIIKMPQRTPRTAEAEDLMKTFHRFCLIQERTLHCRQQVYQRRLARREGEREAGGVEIEEELASLGELPPWRQQGRFDFFHFGSLIHSAALPASDLSSSETSTTSPLSSNDSSDAPGSLGTLSVADSWSQTSTISLTTSNSPSSTSDSNTSSASAPRCSRAH